MGGVDGNIFPSKRLSPSFSLYHSEIPSILPLPLTYLSITLQILVFSLYHPEIPSILPLPLTYLSIPSTFGASFPANIGMGSVGNDDADRIKQASSASTVDVGDTEVQNFDSQCTPPRGDNFEDGEADELYFVHDTLPFEDTVPVEDPFETQLLNLGDETQLIDDLDCIDNAGTQLIDEFNNEVVVDTDDDGTERTEVLDDSSDARKEFDSHSEDTEKLQCDSPNNCVDIDQHTPEPRGYERNGCTAIHAASPRASGMVACGTANCGYGSFSISRDISCLKQHAVENEISIESVSANIQEQVNQECVLGKGGKKSVVSRSECEGRVGTSSVRKLFEGDALVENEEFVDVRDSDCGAQCNNELRGLSYIDSQEPGDASQANALDFVDRFVSVKVAEFNEEVYGEESTRRKSNPISCSKGPQSLAKRSSMRGLADETRIYDFDDSREDEGGGDLLCRRKEDLYNSRGKGRKSFTQPRRPRTVASKRKGAEEYRKEEKLSISNKIKALVHSDSKVVLDKSKKNDIKVPAAEMAIRKNIIGELNEQLNLHSSDEQLQVRGTEVDVEDVVNVGFDTQLAAEAMEALSNGAALADPDATDKEVALNVSGGSLRTPPKGETKKVGLKKVSSRKRKLPSDAVDRTMVSKKTKQTAVGSIENLPILLAMDCRQFDNDIKKSKRKRIKLNSGKDVATSSRDTTEVPSKVLCEGEAEGIFGGSHTDEIDTSRGTAMSTKHVSVERQHFQEELRFCTPIAHRTRQHRIVNRMSSVKNVPNDSREDEDDVIELGSLKQRGKLRTAVKSVHAKKHSSRVCLNPPKELKKVRKGTSSNQSLHLKNVEESGLDINTTGATDVFGTDVFSFPRGKRSRQAQSAQLNKTDSFDGQASMEQEAHGQSSIRQRRSKTDAKTKIPPSSTRRVTRSSADACPPLAPFASSLEVETSDNFPDKYDGKNNRKSAASVKGTRTNSSIVVSPNEKHKASDSACTTPASCTTPANAISPICMGNEYLEPSCKKSFSRSALMKELDNLVIDSPQPASASKSSRRRRDVTSIRVLFSHHLNDDIIKQQKKVMNRLGVSLASSIFDATHFITDQFVRTRNMLEAIANGKPVVNHLWLESCGQACCFIDEKNYVLRDAKKEKEIGFSMPVSLARAIDHPLLQGRRVFITQNTKPGKDIIASLVKAVRGQVLERVGRSAFKDDSLPDDLLVLSCEEDYSFCLPFLERGAAVYSSELLLNGIVTQKLQFERHQLFVDRVKRTRSTLWLRKDGNQFHPVAKRS